MFAWIIRWPRHAATCGAVALALLAYGAWSTWAIMTAKPQPTVDYIAKLNELTMEGQQEGEDAWPVYREIIYDSLGYTDERPSISSRWNELVASLDALQPLSGEWTRVQSDLADELIDNHKEHVEALRVASSRPYFHQPILKPAGLIGDSQLGEPIAPVILVEKPSLVYAYGILARLNVVAIRTAANNEDWKRVRELVASSLRFGAGLAHQPFVLEAMMGRLAIQIAIEECAHVFNDNTLSEAEARAFLAIFDSADWMGPFRSPKWIRATEMTLLDSIQWTYAESGPNSGLFCPGYADRMVDVQRLSKATSLSRFKFVECIRPFS